MELREFLAEALTELVYGIADAQEQTKESSAKISPGYQIRPDNVTHHKLAMSPQRDIIDFIDFDVAVIARETKGTEGGLQVSVMGVGGGGGASSEASSESTSRIRFRVPVVMPTLQQ